MSVILVWKNQPPPNSPYQWPGAIAELHRILVGAVDATPPFIERKQTALICRLWEETVERGMAVIQTGLVGANPHQQVHLESAFACFCRTVANIVEGQFSDQSVCLRCSKYTGGLLRPGVLDIERRGERISHAEIAELHEVSRVTVSNWERRALARVRAKLGKKLMAEMQNLVPPKGRPSKRKACRPNRRLDSLCAHSATPLLP